MKRESLHPKGQNGKAKVWILSSGMKKYVGDCEMQKTVTVDFLSHKTIPNNGEAPKFYVTDHHVRLSIVRYGCGHRKFLHLERKTERKEG